MQYRIVIVSRLAEAGKKTAYLTTDLDAASYDDALLRAWQIIAGDGTLTEAFPAVVSPLQKRQTA